MSEPDKCKPKYEYKPPDSKFPDCLPPKRPMAVQDCDEYCSKVRELEVKRCEDLRRKVKSLLEKSSCPSTLEPFAEGPTMKYANPDSGTTGTADRPQTSRSYEYGDGDYGGGEDTYGGATLF